MKNIIDHSVGSNAKSKPSYRFDVRDALRDIVLIIILIRRNLETNVVQHLGVGEPFSKEWVRGNRLSRTSS